MAYESFILPTVSRKRGIVDVRLQSHNAENVYGDDRADLQRAHRSREVDMG